ncbi:hypothetical protein D0809_09425 [Flavobacterium circumlabens]|uniref:Uncharacterized protein n=1 Tax=Flavobacterium circumlabens TaxID=2133765 RepID=A0A4Y7UHM7_9FLAO|nr:hypothetical protein [Flavobacterium circumlabens]TCN60143.1 hypothetical protein EV142_102763 [Flavobacterium circumlabens]TEB45369.1 hypothetical protein D0809_09425 [Flavobacterium circumlabens]
MGDENVDEIIKDFISLQNDIVIDRYSDSGANGELYFGKRELLSDRVAIHHSQMYSKKNTACASVPLVNIEPFLNTSFFVFMNFAILKTGS